MTWTVLDKLAFDEPRPAARALNRFAIAVATLKVPVEVERLLHEHLGKLDRGLADLQAIRTMMCVLADLVKQGWGLRVRSSKVEVQRPATLDDAQEEKRRVQAQLHCERDDQLRDSAVVEFVRNLERRRVHDERFVSIFSLMRDGRALATELQAVRQLEGKEQRRGLRQVIRPYVQVVNPKPSDDSEGDERVRDVHTGLDLMDIWLYFRRTWSNPYHNIFGRGMQLLIRDAAAPNHPVIGIAALGSGAVQIRCRDDWIGWTEEAVLADFTKSPTLAKARWLRTSLDEAIARIYTTDLIADEVISAAALKRPTAKVVSALEEESKRERAAHHAHADATEFKRPPRKPTDAFWLSQAKTHLFRSKRAAALARLLRAKATIDAVLGQKPTKAKLTALLTTKEGRRALGIVVRLQKGERVGVSLADIVVCGAVAPYNALLGGKLVSMLLASPEVTAAYYDRYRKIPSVIASSTAGRTIVKEPRLVLMGTTSLYASSASQYNRIAVPCERVGGREGDVIRYQELGRTEGFGSNQFSETTSRELTALLQHRKRGQRVNYIFGEGVSPKFRMLREGLEELGLPAELVLNHGSPRLVYGVPLARNFREYLLGISKKPEYYVPQDDAAGATALIVDFWRERWLAKRIERDDVLDQVAQHSLVAPVRHGARVPGVEAPVEEVPLFDDL